MRGRSCASCLARISPRSRPRCRPPFFFGTWKGSPPRKLLEAWEFLKKSKVVIHTLTLQPLQPEHVCQMVADTLSMDIVKAMSLGAYDYWLKPLSMAKLEAGLKRALTRKEGE